MRVRYRRQMLPATTAAFIVLLSSLLGSLISSPYVLASSGSPHVRLASSSDGWAALNPADIIARAKTWVDASPPVGYSKSPPYYPDPVHGYRRDCSGYVSMAWQLPPPGRTTYTLPEVADVIGQNDLQPGDVLNNRDGEGNPDMAHVVIFAGWVPDSNHTAYHAYDENGDGGPIYVPEMPYPYWPTNLQGQPNYLKPTDYVPLRLDLSKVHAGTMAPSPTSSARPGGLWISPANGQLVSGPVHFSAWAYPTHVSDPPIAFVRFTVGPQGSWRVVCTVPPPMVQPAPAQTPVATPLPAPNAQQFSCNADLSVLGISSGPIQVSFDVYDVAGNVNLAPNGIHVLTFVAPTPTPTPKPTPIPLTAPILVSPPNGTLFYSTPNSGAGPPKTFIWQPVHGAVTYTMQMTWNNPGDRVCRGANNPNGGINATYDGISGTTYSIVVGGAQPSCWRVYLYSSR